MTYIKRIDYYVAHAKRLYDEGQHFRSTIFLLRVLERMRYKWQRNLVYDAIGRHFNEECADDFSPRNIQREDEDVLYHFTDWHVSLTATREERERIYERNRGRLIQDIILRGRHRTYQTEDDENSDVYND